MTMSEVAKGGMASVTHNPAAKTKIASVIRLANVWSGKGSSAATNAATKTANIFKSLAEFAFIAEVISFAIE